MKVSFRRSGGFAPMLIGCTLDTATMLVTDAQRLEQLVNDGGIMQVQSAEVEGARDVYYYDIEIERDGEHKKWHLEQLSLTRELKRLVEFLCTKSGNLLPDD